MPFRSLAQMRGAFSGKLGPEMKAHSKEWLAATKNAKDLPEHIIPKKAKMEVIKKAVSKHTGKGGPLGTLFTEAAAPINLLKSGAPPTAKGIPRTKVNSLGNK